LKLIRFAMPVVAIFAIAGSAAAADTYRYTLQINGVGPNPFAISSLQFGVGVGIGYDPGGGIQTSAPSISEITITKTFDMVDPAILGGIAQGTVYPNARIRGYKNMSATPFLDIALEEVVFSGHSFSAATNSPGSTSASLWFRSITINGAVLDKDAFLNVNDFNTKVASLLAKAYATADKPKAASKVTVN
jgi:type VI protein secretion system component Hcp